MLSPVVKQRLLAISKISFLAFLILGSIFIIRTNKENVEQVDSGAVFGTRYHIKYFYKENLNKAMFAKMQAVNQSMSLFKKESTLSKINANRSNETDSLLRVVFALSKTINQTTSGAFDITVAPLVNAWGFGKDKGQLPSKEKIDSIMPYIGFEHVKLEGHKIVKTSPHIELDFGAIAKGFAVDLVAQYLDSLNVKNYMVEIGGEIRVKGHNIRHENFKKWQIGLEKPLENKESVQTMLPLTDCAIATSGNYRNYYYKNGVKYAHTIDPKTGRPVEHSLLSATVIAPDCATADAYATAFMVMGMDKAKKILRQNKQIKVYFIYDDKGELKTWSNLPHL